jgi:hypothetical protein
MRKQWLVLLIAVLASAMLWGCGSSGGGGDEVSTTPDDVATAESVGNCTICHTLDVHTEVSGIAGKNFDDTGFGSAITHDCEACHGGGQYHRGQGPIPYPEPDGEQCAECHDQTALVLASKHNGEDAENVEMLADGHDSRYCQRCHTAEGSIEFKDVIGDKDTVENGVPEPLEYVDSDGNHILHMPTCAACHNPLTKELQQFDTASWDPNQNGESDELDMCTSCHNYKTADGSQLFGSGSTDSGTAEFYHDTAWYRNITTTHYDDPATTDTVEGYVLRETGDSPCFDCHGHELLTNTRYADDPEESTIHSQWAQSGHAGQLLTQVIAAVDAVECPADAVRGRCDEQTDAAMAAYVSEDSGAAWVHYDWDATTEWNADDSVIELDRGECQECHTATGAANYLDDPDAYDPLNNDFSHLEGWSADGGANGETVSSGQNELLYCWGCHSDAEEGELRNPGAISRPYTVDDETVTLPDLGNSNVCANCHGARGNMDSYAIGDDPLTGDPSTDISAYAPGFGANTANVTEAHYLVASATVFQSLTRIGYEYGDNRYDDPSYFAHDAVGLNADSPETGSGPCAACHMGTEEGHKFEVVEKDDSGVITAINASICVTCHDGEYGYAFVTEDTTTEYGTFTAAGAAAALEEEAEGYHEALEILLAGLENAGLTWTGGYPYFSGASWVDEGTFGAAHNYNYLHHEPGAYAHNRYYAKRLIFDSIDWLDNGALDGSITIDDTAYPEAAAWLGAEEGVASRP